MIKASRTISRVMSRMIIYLGLPSPAASSGPPESSPGRLYRFLFGLASNGVYMCPARYRAGGSLLHCLSTLTQGNHAKRDVPGNHVSHDCRNFQVFHAIKHGYPGGIFLLHCPWSHLHRTLSGILPCEARTFLTRGSCPGRDHLFYLLLLRFHWADMFYSLPAIYDKS